MAPAVVSIPIVNNLVDDGISQPPAKRSMSSTPSWGELLGSNNWADLKDPIQDDLRRFIIRCGDFTQVTYDAFNNDEESRYCGSCRYGKANLLKNTTFPFADDYNVAEILYATVNNFTCLPVVLPGAVMPWSTDSNFMGYIAVSTDDYARATGRREIYVCWRGTICLSEWINNVKCMSQVSIKDLVPCGRSFPLLFNTPKIGRGWHDIYTASDPKSTFSKSSARDQLLFKLSLLVDLYKDENLSIVCVGHSLGGAIAVVSAFDIVMQGLAKNFPVCAMVFGCPRVGNRAFKDLLNKQPNLKVLHVKNRDDVVPNLPPLLARDADLNGVLVDMYDDTGVVIKVNSKESPYLDNKEWFSVLEKGPSLGDLHNLEGILHTVAGWNGKRGKFELRVPRCLALVNKSCAYLKDEYGVPACWWVEKNKGMVRKENGEWVLQQDEPEIPEVLLMGA